MNSIYKLLDYVAKVSKEKIWIDDEGMEAIYSYPVTQVTISDKFFIKDDCSLCGRCCVNENNAFTKSTLMTIKDAKSTDYVRWGLDFSDNAKLMQGIIVKGITINDNDVLVFEYPKDKTTEAQIVSFEGRPNLQRCHWMFLYPDGTYRCRIHPVRSVTCGMPHLRFFHNEKTQHTSLGVSPYGRNWALGCPVTFGEFDEESTKERIFWLHRLNEAADDLNIKTYLPEILEYLDNGGRKAKVFPATGRRRLF